MGGIWVHRLSDIDADAQTATCAACGPNTPVRFRRSHGNWTCCNKDKSMTHRSHAEAKQKELLQKLRTAQSNRCAICDRSKNLVLDHCHRTGFVRAALCGTCNSALGMFGDNPETLRKAAEYVEKFTAVFEGDSVKVTKY